MFSTTLTGTRTLPGACRELRKKNKGRKEEGGGRRRGEVRKEKSREHRREEERGERRGNEEDEGEGSSMNEHPTSYVFSYFFNAIFPLSVCRMGRRTTVTHYRGENDCFPHVFPSAEAGLSITAAVKMEQAEGILPVGLILDHCVPV